MLQQKIKDEVKESMKAKDKIKILALKGLLSAFTNELVVKKRKPSEELNDEDCLSVIKRAVKQRKDSIEQFKKGGREDLAEKEENELKILNVYLPETISQEEIKKIAQIKKEEMKIADKSKMGMLMGALMKELKNKADGNDVKEAVEELFC